MYIESGNDVAEQKDGKDKGISETDIEQSADQSSLDSTFEHSLDEEEDYAEKTDDDGKEQETADKQIVEKEEEATGNDKNSDNGKNTVKKIISEVKDGWSDDEKMRWKEITERSKKDNQKTPSTAAVAREATKVEKTYKNSNKKALPETTVKASPETEPKSIRAARTSLKLSNKRPNQLWKRKLRHQEATKC